MNLSADWIIRAYARSLVLYPRRYRGDFGDEMQAVFNLRVKDMAGQGLGSLLLLALRELIDLPLTLLTLYARERRMSVMQKQLNRWFIHEPGSWQEVLLACLPFLVLFLFPGIFSFPGVEDSVPAALGLGLLGLLVLMLSVLGIAGLLVRLPRWALPYAGVLIIVLVFIVLSALKVPPFVYAQSFAPWWLRLLVLDIICLSVLAGTMILLVWLAGKIPLAAGFYEQVRKDWSLFSFAMYGGAMILVLGMYEDVPKAGLYILATAVPVLLGAWAYLRLQAVHWRMIAMFAALTVAMGITLAANIQLVDWVSPVEFSIGGLDFTRSILSVIMIWPLSVGMLFLPMLLPLIPFSRSRKGGDNFRLAA